MERKFNLNVFPLTQNDMENIFKYIAVDLNVWNSPKVCLTFGEFYFNAIGFVFVKLTVVRINL